MTESRPATYRNPGTYYVDTTRRDGTAIWRTPNRNAYIERDRVVITHAEMFTRDPVLWPVLVGALTHDARTVERVARSMSETAGDDWDKIPTTSRDWWRDLARAALTGLLPPQCTGCGRIMPADEAAAGFDACEHCTRATGQDVTR